MLEAFEFIAIVLLCYVLPIVHVVRSSRTPPKMAGFWIGAIVLFSLVGYLFWWMMSPAQVAAKDLDPAKLPNFPARPGDGSATLYLVRWAFFGLLVNNRVYLDDRTAKPIAQVRGRACVTVSIPPGEHTLIVNAGRWLEFPFTAHAGDVLAFSLNPRTETPLSNSLDAWLGEPEARYHVARLTA